MRAQPFSSDPRTREVRRLKLRVANDDAKLRARIALEDGLATADFGDMGRLVLVRRLALRPLGTDFNGPAAARAIESSFRALAPSALHATDERAPSAAIVWFADRLEVLLEALSAVVERRPLTAWFWRAALAEALAPAEAGLFGAGVDPSVASLAAAIAAPETRGAAAPHVAIAALAQRWRSWSDGAFARLITDLPEAVTADVPAIAPPARAPPGGTHIYVAEPRVTARVALAARIDMRKARWVARAELAALGAAVSAGSEVALADELVAQALGGDPAPSRPTGGAAARDAAASSRSAGDAVLAVVAPVREPAVCETEPAPQRRERAAFDDLRAALPPWLEGARPSAHAGFCMLLNAWTAVDFDGWLDAQAAELREPIAQSWLDGWARRLRLPADDPQRLAWDRPHARPPDAATAALADWTKITRRWLRTRARIGPASLVARFGAVSITSTHVDVVLPLAAIDLRARRVGLDRDPGWVPWLGRIVAFHYVAEERTHG